MHKNKKEIIHFSGLNGLRAIAALSVLFAHISSELSSFGLSPINYGNFIDGTPKGFYLAQYGVTIFFALSGFLITYLLLEEKKVQDINIKNFYMRRILRIWPLYYLYLLLAVFTLLLFDLPFEKQSILFYVFLSANVPLIVGGAITFLVHYWSLGVEEQFYGFWPWIIKKSKSILTVTLIICISLILLKCALRYLDLETNKGQIGLPYETINTTRFQCLLIGAIAAILYFRKNELFLKLLDNWLTQCLSWLVIVLIATNQFHFIPFFDQEFISILTVSLIIGQIQKKHRIINLDTAIFNFIGRISYGIYVLHPLLIFYLSKVIQTSDQTSIFNYLFVYFSVFLSTILVAYLSYNFFEKRFLTLKEKYARINSSD